MPPKERINVAGILQGVSPYKQAAYKKRNRKITKKEST